MKTFTRPDGQGGWIEMVLLSDYESLRGALQTLTSRLRVIHEDPHYLSVWTSYQIHGGDYSNGPKYEQELISAEAALQAAPAAKPSDTESDTARLDWLEKYFSIDDVGDETSVPGWYIQHEKLEGDLTWGPTVNGRAPLLTTWESTLRAAIDSAMSLAASDGKKGQTV